CFEHECTLWEARLLSSHLSPYFGRRTSRNIFGLIAVYRLSGPRLWCKSQERATKSDAFAGGPSAKAAQDHSSIARLGRRSSMVGLCLPTTKPNRCRLPLIPTAR